MSWIMVCYDTFFWWSTFPFGLPRRVLEQLVKTYEGTNQAIAYNPTACAGEDMTNLYGCETSSDINIPTNVNDCE